MDWVKDVASNLLADLLALALVYAAGLRFLDRFVEHAASRRIFVVVEADMENFDHYYPTEPPRRLRVTNLSDLPFYDCLALVRDHDVVPTPFGSVNEPLIYDEALPAGETTYSEWFTVVDGKVFDGVSVLFRSVSGVRYGCEAVGVRPARARAMRESPWAVVKRWARRRKSLSV